MTETPRGNRWALYLDDLGNPWALQVDASYAMDPDRGWTAAEPGTFPLPRGWRPRRVVGWDESGRIRSTIVAALAAPLWTGVVGEFFIEGSDLVHHIVKVTGRMEEARPSPAAPAIGAWMSLPDGAKSPR